MTPLKSIVIRLCLCVMLFAPLAAAPAQSEQPRAEQPGQVHVIEARYIDAAELADALRPFLREGGIINVQRQRVIVRSDEANLAELKQLAAELDRARTEFMLHVRQSLGETGGASASGTGRDDDSRTHRYTTAPRANQVSEQRIRLSDGQSAFIGMGRERPSVTRMRGRHGYSEQLTGMRSGSGLLVSLRELSDAVELRVKPYYKQEQENRDFHFDLAAAASSLQITTGQWHELGRIRRSSGVPAGKPNAKRYSTAPRDAREYKIEVFVEEIGPARREAAD